MIFVRYALAAVALAAVSACSSTGAAAQQSAENALQRTVWIVSAEGRAIGQANFREGPDGAMIRLEFGANHGLSPGWHGLHLHEVGTCSDFAAGFQASGGHLGMRRHIQHGLMSAEGPEAGDLPNIFAPPGNGPFGAEMFSPLVTLADARNRVPLLDDDGTALMIHAGPDDHVTQPIGGAGARVACAPLTRLP